MCGIVGFTGNFSNKLEIIKKMSDKIAHRGPDNEGFYIDDFLAFGHRRLAILDKLEGSQPMMDKRKEIIVIFNGEIYNYPELKKELIAKNYHFKTNCDTEILVHGYKEWQEKLPSKLRGMFAFAIYDKKNKLLFCARDTFGIKPFYYYQKKNIFLFSSEIKAFLEHPAFKKELNKELIAPYLMFGFTPTKKTFFKDVFHLEPGHYLIYRNNKIEIKKYDERTIKEEKNSFKDNVNKIDYVVKESVQKHLQSDVEISSFLSSGIDSSYIVSLAKPKKTYTIGYSEESYSEIEYAKDLSHKLNIKNESIEIKKEEYLKAVPKIMYYMDEPLSDAAAISLYFLSGFASRNTKVVLSGEGADEFFGGYNTYKEIVDAKNYRKIPFIIRHAISKLLSFTPEIKGRNFLVRNGEKMENSYVGINPVFTNKECKKVLKEKNKIKIKELLKEEVTLKKEQSDLAKMQTIDIHFWLTKDILQKADRMTMAHSLELRVPFIDKEVYKVARLLPQNQKVTKENTKIALRASAKKYIPNEAYKKKKLGFPVPLRKWIREPLFYNEIASTFKKEYVSEFFNQEMILKLLKKCQKNKKDMYKKVWAVYTFMKWYEVYFLDEV